MMIDEKFRQLLISHGMLEGLSDEHAYWWLDQFLVHRGLALEELEKANAILKPLHQLREPEGASVTFNCDNPDFNGRPNCVVTVCDDWTDYHHKDFRADTLAECLQLAVKARDVVREDRAAAAKLQPNVRNIFCESGTWVRPATFESVNVILQHGETINQFLWQPGAFDDHPTVPVTLSDDCVTFGDHQRARDSNGAGPTERIAVITDFAYAGKVYNEAELQHVLAESWARIHALRAADALRKNSHDAAERDVQLQLGAAAECLGVG
jgi:hypothetical protein